MADIEPPSDAEVEAAARVLSAFGSHHGWWPAYLTYDTLDVIGKEEFDAIVETVLMAAAEVRSKREK